MERFIERSIDALASRVGTVGVLAIFAGMLALIWPGAATAFVLYFIAAALVVGGAFQIAEGFRLKEHRWLAVIAGALYVLAGVLLFARPLIGVLSLTLLLGFFLVASGAFRLAAAISGEVRDHRVLAGISGLASLALGFMVFRYLPAVSPWMLGMFVGIDMLFEGFALVGYRRVLKQQKVVVEQRLPPVPPPSIPV